MKTAVSIPDDVFRGAERLARRTRKSRSQLYSEAVKEYVARHATDEVTEAVNRVCDQVGDQKDPFVCTQLPVVFWNEASGDRSGRGVVGGPAQRRQAPALGSEGPWSSCKVTL